jgi:hypothetical protein
MKKCLLLSCFVVFFLNFASGQEKVISGKVTSAEDGSGLPGVNVLVKRNNNGYSYGFQWKILPLGFIVYPCTGFFLYRICIIRGGSGGPINH